MHIRYRLFLQIVFFLIFVFAGVSIFWLSSSQINRVRQYIYAAKAMREDLNQSYVQYTNFLLRSDTDQQFVSKGENRFTEEFKNLTKNVYDSIGILATQIHFSDSEDKNMIKDSLLSNLDNYRKIFDLVTLAFQQRGIKNAGSKLPIFTLKIYSCIFFTNINSANKSDHAIDN